MKDIKYLLKFGKKEHLEKLQNGDLFFGNAFVITGSRSSSKSSLTPARTHSLEKLECL